MFRKVLVAMKEPLKQKLVELAKQGMIMKELRSSLPGLVTWRHEALPMYIYIYIYIYIYSFQRPQKSNKTAQASNAHSRRAPTHSDKSEDFHSNSS